MSEDPEPVGDDATFCSINYTAMAIQREEPKEYCQFCKYWQGIVETIIRIIILVSKHYYSIY